MATGVHFSRLSALLLALAVVGGACAPAPDEQVKLAQPQRETILGCSVSDLIVKDARSGEIPDVADPRMQLVEVVARTSPITDVRFAARDLLDAAEERRHKEVKKTARQFRKACLDAGIEPIEALEAIR